MILLPPPVERLILELRKLPGIGEKTASRMAVQILTSARIDAGQLAAALEGLAGVHPCAVCGFFTEDERCTLCRDVTRDARLLCVVEQPTDVLALERAGSFRGRYHVLGGVLSPIDGIGPEALRIDGLLARLAPEGVAELVLATGSAVAGEATAIYLARLVRERGVRVTRLAHGVPIGSDLEYLDGATLERALTGRQDF